jgi:hypothetical protein
MKKTLLGCGLVLAALSGTAQVTTYVLQPSALEGALEFTWATGWGSTPDLNDPANTITGFAAFVDDGTTADSLGCNALVNGADIAGKIAVVYRGTCEFGLKALNAENAGAIGVVVVNNVPGAPIDMGAGASGGSVTIPVVMITADGGANLRSEILAGNVELLIGSVQGIFENNISVNSRDVLIAKQTSTHSVLAQNASEFSMNLGGWVHNYGTSEQTEVTMSATVSLNGTELYNNTATPATIPVGDSVFFTLPAFSQASYTPGLYNVTYTLNSPLEENFPNDNQFTFNFAIDSLLAYGRIDPATGLPNQDAFYRPGGTPSPPNFLSCIHFQNANASRVRAEGIYAAATFRAPGTMDGQVLEGRLLQWNDAVTGIADATFNSTALLMTGEYFYEENLANEVVYIPFQEPVVLEDNQRYLFCVFTPSDSVFIGHDTYLNYDENQLGDDQPVTVISDNGTWFAGGFGSDVTSSIAVKLASATVGINERNSVDVTPYPNPTANVLRIPLTGMSGAATLQVFDLSGALVMTDKVSLGGDHTLTMDLQHLANGTYMFRMEFANGQRSDFRVVVTK